MRTVLCAVAIVALLCCACTGVNEKKIRSDYATVIAALQATPSPTPRAAPTLAPSRPVTPAAASLFSTASAATPTPAPPQSPRVVAQGMGQQGHTLSYAFVVENPSTGVALENIPYRATFYNAAGAAAHTDFGIVQLVPPGQQIGQAQIITLIHEGAIDHVEVALQQGRAVPTRPLPEFTADQLSYTPGQSLGTIGGIVHNPAAVAFSHVLVSAIAYDAADRIIGGGFTVLPLLPPAGQARVHAQVLTAAPPDHERLFVELRDPGDFAAASATPAQADLTIVAQGFGQGSGTEQGTVGYGIIVQNGSTSLEYDGVGYQAVFYDANGIVIASEADELERILPGERLGVAQRRVLAQGGTAARMEVKLLPGKAQPATATAGLVGGGATYGPHRGVYSVVGTIRNAGSQDIKAPQVFALAYDAQGRIIGGGATIGDLVPAGREAEVEIFITSAGAPARIELFGSTSPLTAHP
ncbi:MAG TPA: FxLYD domain-containing protein [Dehalococcoidia bacterium]|nr:FxLYD domain-containing protein [Dehalococcoidia bacterium]